jgi:hypothetical protein
MGLEDLPHLPIMKTTRTRENPYLPPGSTALSLPHWDLPFCVYGSAPSAPAPSVQFICSSGLSSLDPFTFGPSILALLLYPLCCTLAT